MKAEIVLLTPKLATELLANNIGNRRLKKSQESYSIMMKNGDWKENGESIIIDKNGLIKDGQHRMYAVIDANYSYRVAIVSDVNPDVMDTIDTGSNRGLSDVLDINGFSNTAVTAAIIKSIVSYNNGQMGMFALSGTTVQRHVSFLSNKKGLDYANENKENLAGLVSEVTRLYTLQPVTVFTKKEIGAMIYMICKYNFTDNHDVFMKNILGITRMEKNAASWVYKKRLETFMNKGKLSSAWKYNAFAKAWAYYVDGDKEVSLLRVEVRVREDMKTL